MCPFSVCESSLTLSNRIFTLVEEFMANVASGGRVRRAYKHLFIDGKEVGNLSVQLEDAINAFLVSCPSSTQSST